VAPTCSGFSIRQRGSVRRVTGNATRLVAGGGATLTVSVSRVGCAIASASVDFSGAPPDAWLEIGTTDIYRVGRFAFGCEAGKVEPTFRLDPMSATAAVDLEARTIRRHLTLQPGQLLHEPLLSPTQADGSTAALTIRPGGEAGWTSAHVTETAHPGCRTDLRALVTAFRTG
jgi:hypothetical protein